MEYVLQLLTNKVLIGTVAAWFIAQLLKVIIDTVKNGFSAERLTGGGGMPSSHSATVTALVTSTALVYGFGGFEFVMALFFAIIVIYDARGVRLETQRQSEMLNKINDEREASGKGRLYNKKYREKLGHTIPEIIAGLAIGLIVGIFVANLPL